MIALHDLRISRAIFKISMKSQFYRHSSRFTSTSSIFFYVFLFPFFFFFVTLALSAIFFPRAIARTVCLPQLWSDSPSRCTFYLGFILGSKSHARNRAQQPRNKICNRKSGLLSLYIIVSRLVSLVQWKNRDSRCRPDEPTRPPLSKGAPLTRTNLRPRSFWL